MAARPRRVAAQKANTAITDMADSEIGIGRASDSIIMSSRPSRRSDARSPPERSRVSNTGGRSSGISSRALGRESFTPGEIVEGKRNRSQRKSYRVDSSEDDDPDAEGEDDDDDMMDADGEIVVDADMDVDAEGEEDDELDAEGEDDMDVDPKPPARQALKAAKPAPVRHSIPSKGREPARASTKATAQHDDSDDEELSDLDSDADEIQDTVNVGGGEEEEDEEDEEEDEEEEEDDNDGAGGGEEDEEEEEEPRELDSDDEGSDGGSPDLDKMTKRQRARFADEEDGALLKLSDEVQAKKVFTAEELSMRRAEMARRRRNLSEKRNEEVKMETIHKLLHKQAPKTNRKQLLAEDQIKEAVKPDAVFVRWVNNKSGSIVAVPEEMLAAPPGRVFVPGGLKSGKMVEEVS